jgi:hypothetical protein
MNIEIPRTTQYEPRKAVLKIKIFLNCFVDKYAIPKAPITERVQRMTLLAYPEIQKKSSWWTAKAKKTPPIAPIIAAPIFIIRVRTKPRKMPMQIEKTKEKIVFSVDKS